MSALRILRADNVLYRSVILRQPVEMTLQPEERPEDVPEDVQMEEDLQHSVALNTDPQVRCSSLASGARRNTSVRFQCQCTDLEQVSPKNIHALLADFVYRCQFCVIAIRLVSVFTRLALWLFSGIKHHFCCRW